MRDPKQYDSVQYTDGSLPFTYTIGKTVSGHEPDGIQIPCWHEQLEFKLILRGEAEIHCGADCIFAEAGDLVIANSCELHSVHLKQENEVCYHLLILSPDQLYSPQLSQALRPVFDGELQFQHHIRGDSLCRELLFSLFRELEEKQEAYPLAAVGHLSLFLAHLTRNYLTTPHQARQDIRRHAAKLEPALAIISEHYQQELHIDALAAACGISTFHFCRLFKLVTGQSVISYINAFRISKAEFLLRSTDLKIGQVAQLVGFESSSYFARVFKRTRGYTPNTCREIAQDCTTN